MAEAIIYIEVFDVLQVRRKMVTLAQSSLSVRNI